MFQIYIDKFEIFCSNVLFSIRPIPTNSNWRKFVKQRLLTLLTFSIISSAQLFSADDPTLDLQDFSAENIEVSGKEAERNTPWSFTAQADVIGKAEIKHGHFKKDEVQFRNIEAELGLVFHYNPAYVEGLNASVGYASTQMKWIENPWFDQSRFNIFSLSIGAFSHRIHKWVWKGQVTFNIDQRECAAGFRYAFYDLLFWGRYEYSKNVGIHIGLIAETGMRTDRVYPILGADWQIARKWKLNLVIPVNVSLEYAMTKKWSVLLAARSFNFRGRLARDEASGKSILRYENIGGELAVKFNTEKGLSFNLHGGSTLGGKFRFSDQSNHHPKTFKLDSSLYGGFEITSTF